MKFFVFIFGLIIGSFLNVCIYRIPKGESIFYPPSHCVNCKTRICWYDLIPVFSYMLLKGRCRQCRNKISIIYPFIELFTGIIFVLVYIKYSLGFEFIKYGVLICFFIIVGMIDFNTLNVYFKITLTGLLFQIVLLSYKVYLGFSIKNYIYGAILGGIIISIIILTTQGMGWGDAEICFLSGLYFGLNLTLVMLFFSFVFGGIISTVLVLIKKKSRKDYIPFVPFISLSGIFTIIFGNKIIFWYLSLI